LDRYPDWTKQQLLLLWFWNTSQEAYDAGDRSALTMQVVQAGSEVGVYVDVPVGPDYPDPNRHSRRVNISNEISELSRGGEAVAVFERVRREEHIYLDLGPGGSAVFRGLSPAGLFHIGKYPDQARRLIEAFEEVRRGIERDTSSNDPQRGQRLAALAQIVSILNGSQELAHSVVDKWQWIIEQLGQGS